MFSFETIKTIQLCSSKQCDLYFVIPSWHWSFPFTDTLKAAKQRRWGLLKRPWNRGLGEQRWPVPDPFYKPFRASGGTVCGAIHRQHFGLHVLLGGNYQWCFHVALANDAEGCVCCVSGWYGCSWLFQILPKIWVFKAPSSSPGFSKFPCVWWGFTCWFVWVWPLTMRRTLLTCSRTWLPCEITSWSICGGSEFAMKPHSFFWFQLTSAILSCFKEFFRSQSGPWPARSRLEAQENEPSMQ